MTGAIPPAERLAVRLRELYQRYGFRQYRVSKFEEYDLYAMGEVLMLAARSLEAVGPQYVLELSHMGILTGVLDTLTLPAGAADAILAAFEAKNAHGLASVCAGAGVDGADAALLDRLCRLSGTARPAVEELLSLPLPPAAKQAAVELEQLTGLLALFGAYNVTVDLSLINDTDYYNGLLFRGYVDGVAAPVLTGGRYDSLIHRMGKRGGAIGFAVYLNELERLLTQPSDRDVDTLLVYGPGDDPAAVIAAVQGEIDQGRTVRAQPDGETTVTYGRCIRPDGREVT